jgi:ATP-binding cassette subfamily F protein uup
MILVDVDDVSMTRPERTLFRDVKLTIADNDRLGILGINGVGKSTLLEVIVGQVTPESGDVRRGRDTTVAMLDQRPEFEELTVRSAVGEGWEAESILDRLGMGEYFDADVSTLSGGQRKRVALARALMAEVDLLVLDEPTNHLDIEAIEWLEHRLVGHRGGLIIVTHDRQLLDKVTTRVLELDRTGWFMTDGGYQRHLQLAAERAEKADREEASRKILARQELAWISRGARARRRKPKARITQARAVIDGPASTPSSRSESLALDGFSSSRLGDRVIDLEGVAFAHPSSPMLFSGFDLSIEPGARLGVIGPNGAGKSTLLDLMARRREPTEGSVEWGSTVRLGYLDQAGSQLDPELRVRQTLTGDDGRLTVEQRQLLERFWFDADAQQAYVGTLSGGERRRLELLMVLGAGPNVLLLDEPTNDLDLDTLRALESFLDGWVGALVVVSHDRVFLERTVEQVVAVREGVAERVGGGDAVWQAVRSGTVAARAGSTSGSGVVSPPAAAVDGSARKRRSPSTLRRLIGVSETSLVELGDKRDELSVQLAGAPDHTQLAVIGQRLTELEGELAVVEEEWLALSAELEEVEGR